MSQHHRHITVSSPWIGKEARRKGYEFHFTGGKAEVQESDGLDSCCCCCCWLCGHTACIGCPQPRHEIPLFTHWSFIGRMSSTKLRGWDRNL